MVRKYRKPRKIKKQQSIFKTKLFWFVLLFIIFVLFFLYLFIFHNYFQIKEIKIHGSSQEVLVENIREKASKGVITNFLFLSTKSIFLIDFERIKKSILDNYHQIENLELEKRYPGTIVINIKERKEVAFYCEEKIYFFAEQEEYNSENEIDIQELRDNKDLNSETELEDNNQIQEENGLSSEDVIIQEEKKCFAVDSYGVIFQEVFDNFESENKLFIKFKEEIENPFLGEKIIEKELLDLILNTKKDIEKNIKIAVMEFTVLKDKRVNFLTQENWEIYFDFNFNIDSQILKLQLVLEKVIPLEKRKDLEYIDVRVGDIASYKYR